MAVKDLFSNSKKYISRKQMREDFRRDPTFQKIVSDPKIKRIIGRQNEHRSLHRLMIKEARDGKLDAGEMQKIGQELTSGKVEGISSAKGHSIAREFFPNSQKKYEPKKPQPAKSSANNSTRKISGALPDYFRYRAKSLHASPKEANKENKFTSFYGAMRSVNLNKRP